MSRKMNSDTSSAERTSMCCSHSQAFSTLIHKRKSLEKVAARATALVIADAWTQRKNAV